MCSFALCGTRSLSRGKSNCYILRAASVTPCELPHLETAHIHFTPPHLLVFDDVPARIPDFRIRDVPAAGIFSQRRPQQDAVEPGPPGGGTFGRLLPEFSAAQRLRIRRSGTGGAGKRPGSGL